MKKIKLGICAVICALCALSSCTNGSAQRTHDATPPANEVVVTVTHANGPTKDKIKLYKFTYEGHEYLYFVDAGYRIACAGLTHSGTCPCHNKTNNHVQN